MKVFVTGASGFIGSATVEELISHGHTVVGLARSDASAEKVKAMGAEVLRGDLEDEQVLKQGASSCDAVIHLGFIHDMTDFAKSIRVDRQAILTMCGEIKGTQKPIVASFGTLLLPNDHFATEEDKQPQDPPFGLRAETHEILLNQKDVIAMALRLTPTVHGEGDRAFINSMIRSAREKGRSPFVGEGLNRWPAVHRKDAANLFRLAIENPHPGATLHAVHEEGVTLRDIATTIGKHLQIPVESIQAGDEANAHFGFLGALVAIDNPTSSAATRKTFGWTPKQKGLLADIDEGHYFENQSDTNFKTE